MIQIDKNIPLPPRSFGKSGGRPPKYPWKDMAIGDSFLVEGRSQNSVTGHCAFVAKRYGTAFTTRKEVGGIRVWRIA